DPGRRFRAACVLSTSRFDHGDKKWDAIVPFMTERLLIAIVKNPGDYGPLTQTLRPVGHRLTRPLATAFLDPTRSEAERTFARTILVEYAKDDPTLLTHVLLACESKDYDVLLEAVKRHANEVLPLLRAEIAKKPVASWGDLAFDSSWSNPDPTLVRRV